MESTVGGFRRRNREILIFVRDWKRFIRSIRWSVLGLVCVVRGEYLESRYFRSGVGGEKYVCYGLFNEF